MGGCGECMAKFGLVVFNLIFLLSGVAVLGVGIWVKVDKNVVNMQDLIQFDTNDKALDKAAWVLIGFGSFVLLISVFGFIAAFCKLTRFFVGMYIAFLVIVFIGEFAGGISAAVFKGKIDDELPNILQKSFKQYSSSLVRKAWDYIQVWLKCCGSTGIKDYSDVQFNNTGNITYYVPKSCCVLQNADPENPIPTNLTQCEEEAKPSYPKTFTYVKNIGCFASLQDTLKTHLALIIGVGVGIAMIQLLGIVMACCVCRSERVKAESNVY